MKRKFKGLVCLIAMLLAFTNFTALAEEATQGILEKLLVIYNMNAKEIDGKTYYPLHIYSGIDTLNYREVGFETHAVNTDTDVTQTTSTTTVYNSMKVTDHKGDKKVYQASDLDGKYMFGQELLFTAGKWYNKDTELEITPYAVKLDGTKFFGKTIKLSDEIIKNRNPQSALFKEVDVEDDSEGDGVLSGNLMASGKTEVSETEDGKVSGDGLSIDADTAKAEVPAGVSLENGAKTLTLSVSSLDESESGVEAVEGETLAAYDVSIDGVSKENDVPIIVTVDGMAVNGLNNGNIKLYHVEADGTKEMSEVSSVEDLTSHNQFVYDATEGTLTMALANFSEVAVVSEDDKIWEGKIAEGFGGGTGTEIDPYIIANADQLALLSELISNDNANYGKKYYRLNADVNIGGIENYNKNGKKVLFYPIGYRAKGEGVNAANEETWYTYGGAFKGVFDGAGHTIAGIYQNTWAMDGNYDNGYWDEAMGLFGYVLNGTVKNLTVDGFSSDGEFTPTGVIAAYAVNSTFENIALTNCNPRVYNTGNGGIVGVGGNSNDPDTYELRFENITIDNSNKISALWGSWDVACGGLVGMFRGAGHVYMTNCHVAAQIDVYNDVCGNYQYYWYRYAGMMVGTNKNMITDDAGYTVPETSKFHAENCTVHFGTWNNYWYCELVDNTLASYTHDHQFSRLVQVKSVDATKMEYTTLDDEIKPIPTTGRQNYVVVNGTPSTENATCYHFKNGEVWTHDMAGTETVDVDGDGVKETVLKEDRQHYYLPFNQLFTGYGWGVKHIPVYNGDKYAFEGITILDRVVADSVEKFESNGLTEFTTGATVTIGEIFSQKADLDIKNPIDKANVQVFVSPADETSTASAVYTADKSDWTKGTLKFDGLGAATISITDYKFCITTTINVNVVEPDSVQTFDVKFENTDKYLYRVGNQNEIELGSLFKAKSGIDINSSNISVTAVNLIDKTTYETNYTTNNSDWTKRTVHFKDTGVIEVTICEEGNLPTTLKLEVVDAKNITSAEGYSNYNANEKDRHGVVLLNNITRTSHVTYKNCTVYGNGFTYDIRGAESAYNSKQGHGIIITDGATLDNLVIVGDVYGTYQTSSSADKDYNSAIDALNTTIQNCHISNCSTPIRANGVTIKNTTLYGGTVANILISNGINTLENVTTVNYNDGRGVLGFGIVISDGASENVKLVINGELKQYNFVCADDSSSVPDENAKKLFNAMFDSAYSKYHFVDENGKTYVNPGILSMVSTFDESDITTNTDIGYVGTTVTYKVTELLSATGYLYSLPGSGNDIDKDYYIEEDTHRSTIQGNYLPKYDFDLGNQMISNDGADDRRYLIGDKNGIEALYASDESPITLDLTKLATITKYGNNCIVTASYKDNDGNIIGTDTTVSLTSSGILVFDVKYDNYDENGNKTEQGSITYEVPITVSVKQAAVKNATITVKTTSLTGTYTAASTFDTSQYLSFNPLEAITVTDYEASGTETSVDLAKNISDTKIEYNNTSSGAWGGATITMTYTDGRVLTIVLGSTSMNSPGTSNGGKTITVTNGSVKSDGKVAKKSATGGKWPITSYSFKGNSGSTVTTNETVTVTFADKSGCVTADTLVTLADGSHKRIDEVTYEDELLVWDFFNGEYATVPSSIIFYHGDDNYRVLSLKFEDGTVVKVINNHGFFDVAENKFVFIEEANVEDYIGHEFIKVNGGTYSSVKLVDYEVVEEYTGCYSIQTAQHNNFMVEDMFSLTIPAIDGWFDYFEIGDNMKYDEEKMQADIEKYGLYTYEDFAEYVTYEQFIAFNGPYLKVLVGKGVLTYDEILELIATYVNPTK